MLLSRTELKELMQKHNEWHVSIYVPTHQAGVEVLENTIRFRNLLDRAGEQLVKGGLRRPEVEALLGPARALVNDELFWQRQSSGLAVFLAEGLARKYRLPLEFDELVVATDRFHIKPLLSVLSNNGRFYVLALNQHESRLFQATRHLIGGIDLDDMEDIPETIVEILKWEDPEMQLQLHTTSSHTLHQGVEAVFHGHGMAMEDDPKERLLRYFQRLDAGISDLLAGDDAPLVPVADGFVLARYREANTYPHLTEDGVDIVPKQLGPMELHHQAWGIVQPFFARAENRAREVYRHLEGNDSERASNDLREIVPAAVFGRVEGLFVSRDDHRWGVFDATTGEVDQHAEQQVGDADLLDLAAANTVINGGWLFVVDPVDVPGGAAAAAVLRY